MKNFIIGFSLGGSIVYMHMLKKKIKLREALITDSNLRTDLINWMKNEGVYMPADEFWPLFHEKAMYVNIVTTTEDP